VKINMAEEGVSVSDVSMNVNNVSSADREKAKVDIFRDTPVRYLGNCL